MPAPDGPEEDAVTPVIDEKDCVPSMEMPYLPDDDADMLAMVVFFEPSAAVIPFPSTDETEPPSRSVLEAEEEM